MIKMLSPSSQHPIPRPDCYYYFTS